MANRNNFYAMNKLERLPGENIVQSHHQTLHAIALSGDGKVLALQTETGRGIYILIDDGAGWARACHTTSGSGSSSASTGAEQTGYGAAGGDCGIHVPRGDWKLMNFLRFDNTAL